MDIEKLRKDYSEIGLSEVDLPPDPLTLFSLWFSEATACGMIEPNAMALATVDAHGCPNVRFVLLKGFDETGFRFFTNLESNKGHELATNSHAALAIYWDALERQVRISGAVEQLSRDVVEAYFSKRPRSAQIAACCSDQSRPLHSPGELQLRFNRFETEHAGEAIAPPAQWGGYRVIPSTVEFWKGRESRLHDRVRYERNVDGSWNKNWLQP